MDKLNEFDNHYGIKVYPAIKYLVDPSTLCQCTGLMDKNGKLIWENDILDFLGYKGKIIYECGSFGYACKNNNFLSLWEIYWNFNDDVEVIGSAIDNPELLEGGAE